MHKRLLHFWLFFSVSTLLIGCDETSHHADHAHAHSHSTRHHPSAAHVHGVAQLDVIWIDTTLECTLRLPAEDAFGFEGAATTSAQQAQRDARLHAFADSHLRFALNDPQCVWQNFAWETSAQDAADPHSDVILTYTASCPTNQTLQSIDIDWFQLLPSLHTIEVRLLTAQHQSAQTLTPQHTVIRLP